LCFLPSLNLACLPQDEELEDEEDASEEEEDADVCRDEDGDCDSASTAESGSDSEEEERDSLQEEYKVLKQTRHPNIIRLVGRVVLETDFGTSEVVGIVLPFYPEGSLRVLIATRCVTC
jgi:serine/threonine protein kinase